MITVPVRGSIVGHCYYDSTERVLAVGADEFASTKSDALPFVSESNPGTNIIAIRFVKPRYSQMKEIYLSLDCKLSNSVGLRAVLAGGSLSGSENISFAEVSERWYRQTGSASPIYPRTGAIVINELPLKELLSFVGLDRDVFSLILHFTAPPTNFRIDKLNLMLGVDPLS